MRLRLQAGSDEPGIAKPGSLTCSIFDIRVGQICQLCRRNISVVGRLISNGDE